MTWAELRRARVSGGELAHADLGEGEAVVLLHGFPTSSFLWRAVAPAVWQAGMRAVAVGLLGYGASDKPPGAPLDVRAQAGYVRELLDGLGVERYAVVGHDLGGGVAQLLALDDPRVGAAVLVDSIAFDAWPIEGVRMVQGTSPDRESEDLVAALVGVAFDLGMGRRDRLSEADLEAYRAPFSGPEGAAAFFRAVRAIDGLGLAGREADLAGLEIPVLLLWGEDDPFVPVEVAERLADLIPTSSLALLPGCSHLVTEDAPGTVAELVAEWLRARYLGAPHGHGHGHGGGRPVPVEVRPLRREEG